MNWNDIKAVMEQVDADNRASGLVVTVAMQPRGIEVLCQQSTGFFTYKCNKLITYGEVDVAVHFPGLLHATINDVRAAIARDTRGARSHGAPALSAGLSSSREG